MPKNHFDRVAKDIAEQALRSSGVTRVGGVGEEILPETQTADLSQAPGRVEAPRAREHSKGEAAFVDSFLWIIAAGAPKAVLSELRAEPAPRAEWPKGVYTVGGEVLRVGIVVASELPRKDDSTLLVRLLAAGPLLASAIEEVAALPADAIERVIAEPALLDTSSRSGKSQVRTSQRTKRSSSWP